MRVIEREDGSTIYVVENEKSEGTNNASPLPVLGWSGSAAGIWELGYLDLGRGVIVDIRILWSDEESDKVARPTKAGMKCADGSQLRFSGSDSIVLSCPHFFSLRSMSEESDAVFEVALQEVAPQVDPNRVSQVYWHAADKAEVRFAKGTYVIKTRAPRLRAGRVSPRGGCPENRIGREGVRRRLRGAATRGRSNGYDRAWNPPLCGTGCVEGSARVGVAVPTRY